jgi:hypothetical protein
MLVLLNTVVERSLSRLLRFIVLSFVGEAGGENKLKCFARTFVD